MTVHLDFKEPSLSLKYTHVERNFNWVNLLTPIVGGVEISTDNTCKTWTSIREFFDGGAHRELSDYIEALVFDIQLGGCNPKDDPRVGRLMQINRYIQTIQAMKNKFGDTVIPLFARPYNLYSFQLRPREQDPLSQVFNPVFNINRQNDNQGNPLSALYKEMYLLFPHVVIKESSQKSELKRKTLEILSASPTPPSFETIQRVLNECAASLGLTFTITVEGKPATKDTIDKLMGFEGNATTEEYVDALMGNCVSELGWKNMQVSHFYNIHTTIQGVEQADALSILTQFFLAMLNIHCKAKGLSDLNFGKVLDDSPELSKKLALGIAQALTNGDDVEQMIFKFFNKHKTNFGLDSLNEHKTEHTVKSSLTEPKTQSESRTSLTEQDPFEQRHSLTGHEDQLEPESSLTKQKVSVTEHKTQTELEPPLTIITQTELGSPLTVSSPQSLQQSLFNDQDITSVKKKFHRTYGTVTATKENPHMDDFLFLDIESKEETPYAIHQGSICVNFAEIVAADLPHQRYFQDVRYHFRNHPMIMPHKNQIPSGGVDLEPDELCLRLDKVQFEKLSEPIKTACRACAGFQMSQFLHDVAKGKQDEAQALLRANPDDIQKFLTTKGTFIDYSGRTFNCTAYEYAYWAKDTHMCRMLESHMDDKTKSELITKINEIERIDAETGEKNGLFYMQHGKTQSIAHFNFTPLKQALKDYVDGYDKWQNIIDDYVAAEDKKKAARDSLEAARKNIGKAQRDLPAHVAQEYCRLDRSFDPRLGLFEEESLPRDLKFLDGDNPEIFWFPPISDDSNLDIDYMVSRSDNPFGAVKFPHKHQTLYEIRCDLEAITLLDEVRTADLKKSYDILKEKTPAAEMKLALKAH